MNTGLQVRALARGWRGQGISLFIEELDVAQQKCFVAQSLVMQERGINEPANPTCQISDTSAQQLMDDLWQCGLRPSEGTGSAGQLAAVQKHLEDMRQIAFGNLDIVKP